jgi:hypothetical protein
MKVKELIEVLSKYDQELEVIVSANEGGYNPMKGHGTLNICVDYYKEEPWMGKHEYVSFINEHWNGERKEALWLG